MPTTSGSGDGLTPVSGLGTRGSGPDSSAFRRSPARACGRFTTRAPSPESRARHLESLHDQHDLSNVLARFHQTVGFGRFGEWKRAIDDRANTAFFEQRPDLIEQRGRDVTFLLDRAGTQRGAGERQPPAHEPIEIDGRSRPAHEADLHETSVL